MNCPLEVAAILLDLIERGIAESRRATRAGDGPRATREAEHLHTLTHLLHDYSDEQLQFYWQVERPAYAGHLGFAERAGWAPLWDRLEILVDERCEPFEVVYGSYYSELGAGD
jgi:hypothetical protein